MELLHVPRMSSSPIVAAVAECAALHDKVRVRVVGYPDELRSLARPTCGLHQVPALRLADGQVVVESSCIMQYLLEQHETPLSVGVGEPGRAQFLSLLTFACASLKPLVSNQIFLAKLTDQPEAGIAAAMATFNGKVAPFLVSALGDSDFFVAGRLTAVDLAMAKPLGNANALGLLDGFPALKAHYERVSARPSHALGYGALDPGTYVYECGAAAGPGAATEPAHPKLVLADK